MNFFVDLTKSLLSPRASKGFIIGLVIGCFTVAISSQVLLPFLTDSPLLPVIGNLIGAVFVACYGSWFASKTKGSKNFAIGLFFIVGLLGFFLVRSVLEERFVLSPGSQNNNVITFALSGGIACTLAGGFFEAITKSE
ncbi:MAG: hypothetical protein LH613_18030 [Chamaesiphon sp.]|nr:hypothetical protein [Chamaesiphon sp.]